LLPFSKFILGFMRLFVTNVQGVIEGFKHGVLTKRLLYTGRTVCPLVVIFVYYVTQVTDGRHSEYNQGLISITKQVNVNNDINNEQEL